MSAAENEAAGLQVSGLEGTSHVVTGGTQGLGLDVARALARAGAASVVICGRNAEKGREAAQELGDLGTRAHFVRADLTEAEACREVVATAHACCGRLDGLVNAAATTERGTLDDTSAELWDRMFALNVRAPFLLMQEAARSMRAGERGGSIVNILSVSAHGGQPKLLAYSASKAALANATKNAAYGLRGDGIRVNGVMLGWTATENEHVVQLAEGQPEDWLARADASSPMGRILRPDDVSQLALYLLAPASRMMTGALIDLNYEVVGAFD
jgi:NAD(P)-dependent dehydrogenase (short-subunit alcohol dehydrogenase family)